MTLTRREITELEAKYDKYGFCHQCGTPILVEVVADGSYVCPKCGSSDFDSTEVIIQPMIQSTEKR